MTNSKQGVRCQDYLLGYLGGCSLGPRPRWCPDTLLSVRRIICTSLRASSRRSAWQSADPPDWTATSEEAGAGTTTSARLTSLALRWQGWYPSREAPGCGSAVLVHRLRAPNSVLRLSKTPTVKEKRPIDFFVLFYSKIFCLFYYYFSRYFDYFIIILLFLV